MKGYVVTLKNLPGSVKVAKRCIKSAEQFSVEATMFPAANKDNSLEELKKEQLIVANYDTSFSNVGAVMGNFVTQYRIWTEIFYSEEPGIVLEHDAVFVAPVPDLTGKGDIINLGKPSYGNFRKQSKPGVYPMFSKPGGYIPGAHGYYVTKEGAHSLILKARKLGASPCDIFLNKKNFPNIKELYPWVIEAHDSFSTIQNEKGCKAKHNYGPGKSFKVLT